MEWRETYELWQNFEDLDAILKEELANNKDEELLKDAFGASLVQLECVAYWVQDQTA